MNTEQEKKIAESIRSAYVPEKENKLNQLRKLDARVKLPAEIFAYIFGIVGALVLGVGMCLAMGVLADMLPLGVVIGCVGIVMVAVNYFIYAAIVKSRKKKYAAQILALTDELLGR